MVTTINLTLIPRDSASTEVSVVYERTALSAAANDHVQELGAADRARGAEWEKAISAYLQQN